MWKKYRVFGYNNMNEETVFWVDDERDPFSDVWHPVATNKKFIHGEPMIVWFKSYKEFVAWVNMVVTDEGRRWYPTLVCFDHDLGTEKTGLDCAKYLVNACMEHNLELPHYTCHSSNPAGRENILSYLNSYIKSLQ